MTKKQNKQNKTNQKNNIKEERKTKQKQLLFHVLLCERRKEKSNQDDQVETEISYLSMCKLKSIIKQNGNQLKQIHRFHPMLIKLCMKIYIICVYLSW
jgi:hypothetical protein